MSETTPASPSNPLLEAVDTVTVAVSPGPFVVREQFERPTGIRFATVWNEFKKRFYGKTEDRQAILSFRKYRLLALAPDGPIIAEMGGEAAAETTTAAAFALLRLQGKGEEGFLQTNGYANIFYARDTKGVLCAIRVGWDGEGWVVDAIEVEDPLAWNGKHAIFCPIAPADSP
jgi:hypothetical protein